jgi:hypothetical protein
VAYASPPPPIHIVVASASFPLPPVQPILHVHTIASHESMSPPPTPKYHKTTPHGSEIDKGKQLVTSTNMPKSFSSAHSKIKSTSSGKTSLHEVHLEIAQLKEKKSKYEYFIKERDEFFRKKFSELF